MMTRTILLLVLFAFSHVAGAQSKTGTTIGQFLLIEPSARIAAMGNAGTTTQGEITSAFFNPASLGHMAGSDAQFTHSTWLAGITYNYAAAGIRLGSVHTMSLTVTALNSGEMDVRTVDQPLGTGERFSVNDLAFGLGYTRRVTDRFSAGLQVNFVQESIWHSTLNALGLNFGVLYELPMGAFLGASLSNFGTQGRFDGRDLRVRFDQDDERFGDNSSLPAALHTESFSLPILFRVGLGWPLQLNESNTIHVVMDAAQPSDNTSSISFGGEWSFMDILSLRGGYQQLFQEDSETGLTLGVGLNYDVARFAIRVDYAWNDYGRIGDIQRFTVGFGF